MQVLSNYSLQREYFFMYTYSFRTVSNMSATPVQSCVYDSMEDSMDNVTDCHEDDQSSWSNNSHITILSCFIMTTYNKK